MIHAVYFDGAGQPLRHELVPRPQLQPGEVLARLQLCSICGSDLHTYAGRRQEPTPTILGHEMIGEVEELTSPVRALDGSPVHVGDRITWAVAVHCGECFYCRRDWPQKCERLVKYGHVPHGLHGGLASHCQLLAGSSIVKIPAHLADELVTPAMCATATAAGAVRLAAEALAFPQPTALVVGTGLLGCTVVAWLARRGVKVAAVDSAPPRLALAQRCGAAEVFTPDQLPREYQADATLELSGSLAGVQCCWKHVRVGGMIVLIGTVSPTPAWPIVPEQLVRRCLTVRGLHNYRPSDLEDAVAFLAEHGASLPWERLGPRYPLADAESAFRYAEEYRPPRVFIDCQSD